MRHLIDIDGLTREAIYALFDRAFEFKNNHNYPQYPKHVVSNLFYEDSTRTRLSFELAAKRLGLIVLNLDPKRSSETKGESMADMLQTVAAMGVQILVMRHPEDKIFEQIQQHAPASLQLLNAGSGMWAHPTQALLDMMTMIEQGVDLTQAKIAVVGDIRHSRVARSLQKLCALLGVKDLVFTGPKQWLPQQLSYGRITDVLSDALKDADVVMALRVQRERFNTDERLDFEQYRAQYAITTSALAAAKADACVMHPGPINRGVEIDSAVADAASACILKQVENGVFMRMAMLESLILSA
jgi:aspartate carbamoyltransferase catalytic subunit